MKRNLCLVFAILMMLTTLTACKKEPSIIGTWLTKGSIIGLSEETESYDILVNFNDDNTGSVTNTLGNNSIDNIEFEYSVFNSYITFISYDGVVLDKGIHTYPYTIEADVLTINVNNKKLEFNKLKFAATENLNYEHTYEVLQDEYDRILEYLELAYSGDMITNVYIDHSDSAIVVGLKELTKENIDFFKENISDADFIVFEEGGNIVLTTE